MQEFSEHKCAHCSLDCFSHPQADAAQPFFSSQHPFQPKASGSELQSNLGFSEYRAILATTMEENDEEDGVEELRAELEDLFERSPEGQALINEGGDPGWCGILVKYAHSHHGSLPHEITASEVRDVVLSLFPRKVSCSAEDAEGIVRCLRGFDLANETDLQNWMDNYNAELPELPGEAVPMLPSFEDQMPWSGGDNAPASSHTGKQTKTKRKQAKRPKRLIENGAEKSTLPITFGIATRTWLHQVLQRAWQLRILRISYTSSNIGTSPDRT